MWGTFPKAATRGRKNSSWDPPWQLSTRNLLGKKWRNTYWWFNFRQRDQTTVVIYPVFFQAYPLSLKHIWIVSLDYCILFRLLHSKHALLINSAVLPTLQHLRPVSLMWYHLQLWDTLPWMPSCILELHSPSTTKLENSPAVENL